MYLLLALIAHEFRICKFAYSLKFTCDSKISAHGVRTGIHRYVQSTEKFIAQNVSCPVHFLSAEIEQGSSASLFQLSCCKQVLFTVYLVPCVFTFLHFGVVSAV